MAVADANLSFISINIGAYGRESDSSVFKHSKFDKNLYAQQLNIPKPAYLPNTESCPQPYVFLADEAFSLHTNLLRPYPGRNLTVVQRIFNYRLSRARRTVECSFGLLCNKWRVLHTPLLVKPDFADDIIKACCILHNYVRQKDGANYEDMESNLWVESLEVHRARTRAKAHEMEIRDAYADYFMGPGSIPFQYRYV